jgi:formiminotetrahydrofolate cyclodeaminase
MTVNIIEQPFFELIDSVSSKSAAPGGGSVAAAAGALGAGLITMSCKFTIDNEKYREHWDEFKVILHDVEKYRNELIELIDKDAKVYTGIVNIQSSKNTIIEKIGEEEYNQRLLTAYRHASEIPLQTAGLSLKILRSSKVVAEKGNINTITDTGVGAQMAYAGAIGGIFNVKINLKSIKDETYKLNMESIIVEIEDVSLNLLKIVMDIVNSRL